MLKGGVIMDVVTPEEARIAEEAGAVAVMALERVPADIRRNGGVARMSDPQVRPAALRCCSCQCTGLWVAWLGSRAGRRR
jgi:pyridoxal biosynthesis lyase PdxS